MTEQIRAKIEIIRQLFSTVRQSTTQATEAINTLNAAFARFAEEGKLGIAGTKFRALFESVIRDSRASTQELRGFVNEVSNLGLALKEAGAFSRQRPGLTGPGAESLRRFPQAMEGPIAETAQRNAAIELRSQVAGFNDLSRAMSSFVDKGVGDASRVFSEFVRITKTAEGATSPLVAMYEKGETALKEYVRELIRVYGEYGKVSANAKQVGEAIDRVNRATQAAINYGRSGREQQMPLREYMGRAHEMSRIGGTTDVGGFFGRFAGAEGSRKVIEDITKAIKEYGFSLKDLSSVQREASTGMSRLQFRRETQITPPGMRDNVSAFESLNLAVTRSGDILEDNQRRFRSFFDGVTHDIVKAAEWAVAIAVVYAPLRKLDELIQEMVRNQILLAEIQIVTGQSADEVYKSFDRVAKVATATGESVEGTLESFKLAYIAAGNTRDEFLRAAVASDLLNDSLVLSKLSTLSEAEAMDILSAALKQLGRDLTEGDLLLDKWVAVSRQANVSIDTLATSFAIVSSASENVGLDIDQLNGIIASAAEVSNMSARETGNMIRAFISGYQTDTAAKELNKYGIAARDASGNLRGFMEVFTEIRALSDAGLISETQMARLSELLGGGARRGAQLASFIRNLGRIDQITEVSKFAETGQALKALDIRMQTVDAVSNEMRVSFSRLAQSLGVEGGFLDVIISLTKAMTAFTNALTGIVKTLGTSTPIFAGGLFTMLLASQNKGTAAHIFEGLAGLGYGVGSRVGR